MHLPKNDGGNFTPTPAGTHPAVCFRFIDMGTQATTYQGQARQRHEVMLSWEIADPEVRMQDGRPFTMSRTFTWSMSEKSNLRKTLESWRGVAFTDADFGPNGFDIKNIVGKPCLLNVLHKEKEGGGVRDDLGGIMKLPKGMTVAPLVNETIYVALTPELFDREQFAKLSENLQTKIKASPEYRALSEPAYENEYIPDVGPDDYDQAIPF